MYHGDELVKNRVRKRIVAICLFLAIGVWMGTEVDVWAARVKDIAGIKGARPNQLMGYGLVVGLNSTGDDDKTEFTFQSLTNMMKRMGIVIDKKKVDLDNVAGVMVTATLPAFSKVGTRIDVVVSSMGNAKNLQGGTLLLTPLSAPDGNVYAVAQGPLSTGGFAAGGAAGGGVQKNHPTVGYIPGGAIVEKDLSLNLLEGNVISLNLNNPDFTTCLRLTRVINTGLGEELAQSVDAGTVEIKTPWEFQERLVEFISLVENLNIAPDTIAKVVLNERTGTVIMGKNVRISTVAVSHGNLSIIIKERERVSQPLPFSVGETVVTPDTEIAIKEEDSRLMVVPEGVNLREVVRGLNAIGVSPRDLISIFQAIRASGALQAELVII
ncbi:MAG: flagellar basal body P-ring protein FlgI [Deltaproteobacteria bacterium]|nr:flagellar basal body P-ring protein FlgI [Deltaproteobacteria bacterium]